MLHFFFFACVSVSHCRAAVGQDLAGSAGLGLGSSKDAKQTQENRNDSWFRKVQVRGVGQTQCAHDKINIP